MSRHAFRGDFDAVGQVISFLAAGVVFLAAVGSVLVVSRGAGKNDHGAAEASQQNQAERLAEILAQSPGVGWAAGPDNIARLGLRAMNGSGLEMSSLDALRGALFSSAQDGKVDYADARASLGLTGSQDFHLRIAPVGLSSVYKAGDSRQRTALIGDWQSLPTITVALGTSSSEQAAAQAALNATMVGATGAERLALRDLGLNFVDRLYIGSSAPTVLVNQVPPLPAIPLLTAVNLPSIDGGVYPDIKAYLDANLPGRLANYDLLVVGSGVDQSAMTSAATKNAIRDWVLAGGTLVVMGTGTLNYQWLQPLFSAGVKTANGAASAPDPSHPLLQDPNALEWPLYNDHNQGWAVTSPGFSYVIRQAGNGVLALSNDGAFGSGRIILTTYQAREIAASFGQAEADHFLENIVLYTNHARLYLDYGPTQPDGQAVAVAVRYSYVFDPTLGQVPVQLEIHLWGST